MSIIVLKPDPARARRFYIAQQLQTAAWGHGDSEAEARARMKELRRNGRLLYDPKWEVETEWTEGVH